MYRKITAIEDYQVKYIHWSLLLLISLIVSHLIVTESQVKPVLVLIHQHNYQLAMAFTWPFTFLLVLWIHIVNRQLDILLPWMKRWSLRVLIQFVFCVVFVLVLDIALVKLYFLAYNADFHKSGYMEIEFPIVRWMVLFMNSLYIAWYFAVHYRNSKKMIDGLKGYIEHLNDHKEPDHFYLQKIEAKLGKTVIQVELGEVVCFKREEDTGYVYLNDGRTFNIDLTLNELSRLLEGSYFYQINRSVMISLSAIKGYQKVKNRQAKIIFKDHLNPDISLLVSRDRFEGFKKKFDLFKIA